MIKSEALENLDWYFSVGDGFNAEIVSESYQFIKKRLEDSEQLTDTLIKILIYLFNHYKQDLFKNFNCNGDNWIDLLTIYNKIVDEMKKEMPEPWYNYGIKLKD